MRRFNIGEVQQPPALAPFGKPASCLVVGPAGVAVADMRGEETEEPLPGFFIGEKNGGRPFRQAR